MSGKIGLRSLIISLLIAVPINVAHGATAPLIVQKCAIWLGIVEAKPPFTEKYILPQATIKKSDAHVEEFGSVNTSLFSIKDVIEGPHGKESLLIEKRAGWHDRRITREGNLTQDLRLLPVILGKPGARYFGYQHLNETQMVVPTPEELNVAIDEFNNGLGVDDPRRIKIRLYGSSEIETNPEEYIARFVKSGEIPISYSGKQFYHDISVHGLEGFFLNNELIDVLQKRISLWLDFRDTVRLTLETEDFAKWNDAIMKSFATQIDGLGMAAETFSLREDENKLKETAAQLVKESKLPHKTLEGVGQNTALTYELTPTTVPAIVEEPQEYFTNILNEIPTIKNQSVLRDHLSKYLDGAKESKPELFKNLSFDFVVQTRILLHLKNISDSIFRKAVFKTLELSQPYWGRMERLKTKI